MFEKFSRLVALSTAMVLLLCSFSGCAVKEHTQTTTQSTTRTTDFTSTTVTNAATTARKTSTTAVTKKTTVVATTTTVTKVTTKPIQGLGSQLFDYESPAQQAVVETALAYLARGSRIQYADTRLALGDMVPQQVRYRWEHGKNSPEDATAQYYTYTNCAAFTYDVYYHALDLDIMSYTTASLIEARNDWMTYKYYPSGKESAAEKVEIEKTFRDTLKVGDIIVVRYNGSRKGNGHAMLYVGPEILEAVEAHKNNAAEGNSQIGGSSAFEKTYEYDIIHSSGSNYDYGAFAEKFEKNGSISKTSVDMLFDPSSSRYVFSKLLSIGIVRPLNTFEGDVPTQSVNRINNMYGVVAEKLSSHTVGMTVNPGEKMTFTFSIENTNAKPITLEVTDTVPQYTAYVSGADAVNGSKLSWQVTVPAGKTKTVSYTVKVDADVAYGATIHSSSGRVGGVPTECKPVMVAKTLTEVQQQNLLTAVQNHADSKLCGTALANSIYTTVLGRNDLLPSTTEELLEAVFDNYLGIPDYFTPVLEGKYASMLVPAMYGGRYTVPDFGAEEAVVRTRLPYKEQVMIGDILLISENSEGTELRLYLLAGDTAYDLLDGLARSDCDWRLETVLGYNRFAILRPSMAAK